MPSAALYVIEVTFSRGFESYMRSRFCWIYRWRSDRSFALSQSKGCRTGRMATVDDFAGQVSHEY